MNARWHQDSDRWIWRVYGGLHSGYGAVTGNGEDTTDIYIIPYPDGWWIVNAKLIMEEDKEHWIQRVNEGESIRIAGPFREEEHAKAAWRVMYG